MVPALANGEVFAAARRKAHLGVLAAVGGPADAFVVLMTHFGLAARAVLRPITRHRKVIIP